MAELRVIAAILMLAWSAALGVIVLAVLFIDYRTARVARTLREMHMLVNDRLYAIHKLLAEAVVRLDGQARRGSPFPEPPPVDLAVREILKDRPIAPPAQRRKKKPAGLR